MDMLNDVRYLIVMIVSGILALILHHVGHDTESIIFFGFYFTGWILLKIEDAREEIKDTIRREKYAD